MVIRERAILGDKMGGGGRADTDGDGGAALGFCVVGGDGVIEGLIAGLGGRFGAGDPWFAARPGPCDGRRDIECAAAAGDEDAFVWRAEGDKIRLRHAAGDRVLANAGVIGESGAEVAAASALDLEEIIARAEGGGNGGIEAVCGI